MKSLFLAAGYATRLYPLTENYPKPLLLVGEKKILEWLLDDVDKIEEITEHIIVSNHKFIDIFNEWKKENEHRWQKPIYIIDDMTVDNDHRLGAVLDIKLAYDKMGKDEYLVLAGDNILDFSMKGFVDFFNKKRSTVIMFHEENDLKKQQKTGIILMDKDSRVTLMQEKPEKPASTHAVPPFYVYQAKDLEKINEAVADGCNVDSPGGFIAWLCKRENVYAYEMPGKRHDIGDMESYNKVKEGWIKN